MASDDDLSRSLEEFNAEYRRSLPERMRNIDALWSSVKRGEADENGLYQLQRALHSIAGTGLTFGMAALSAAGAAAEDWLELYCKGKAQPPASVHADFEPLLDAVKQAAAQG